MLDTGSGGVVSPPSMANYDIDFMEAYMSKQGLFLCVDRDVNVDDDLRSLAHEVDEEGYFWLLVPMAGYSGQIGNVQGGWAETKKYKDKNGDWVTRKAWGSGKAGW